MTLKKHEFEHDVKMDVEARVRHGVMAILKEVLEEERSHEEAEERERKATERRQRERIRAKERRKLKKLGEW